SGRAAISLEIDGRDEPTFGVFWFEAAIDTDTDAGTALIRDVTVTDVRWPDSTDADEQRFTSLVHDAVSASGFEISLERLSATLEGSEAAERSLADLKNDPPRIVFRDELSVLLLYDGEPRFAPVE